VSEPLPVVRTKRRKPTGWRKQDAIRITVIGWFVLCWIFGAMRAESDVEPFLQRAWPDASYQRIDDDTYRVVASDESLLGYATVGTASGYGGPLRVGIAMDTTGIVQSLAVLEHRETPSFFNRVLRDRLLHRLVGKSTDDAIVLGQDIDAVTGATYTSLGLVQSVHRGARKIATDQLQVPVPPDERRIVFGLPEVLLIALFAIGVLQRQLRGRKKRAMRWVTLLTGLVFLGFVYNAPFVLAHLNMVLVGYWPEWQTHLYWYILILGLLLFKAKREWNVYCYDFCPFGALQEVMGAIGGAKPRRVRWPAVLLWSQRLVTLAAISLALIYRNPGLTSYEIFGTAFRLEGSSFQFALLAIIVLISLFIHRPWCRYLCPLHKNTAEGLFDNTRRIARTTWQKVRRARAA
jgi:uncharacterized protein with FMN-binding domain